MLADASDNSMGQFVWGFIGLATGAAAVFSIIGVFRKQRTVIDEQPLEVSGSVKVSKKPEAASREICDARHSEIARRLSSHDEQIAEIWRTVRVEIPEMERRLNAANEERIGKIHSRINEVLRAVSELSGKMDSKS